MEASDYGPTTRGRSMDCAVRLEVALAKLRSARLGAIDGSCSESGRLKETTLLSIVIMKFSIRYLFRKLSFLLEFSILFFSYLYK